MFSKFFSNDEIAALAYNAKQVENAGYPNKAAAIRHQPLSLTKVTEMISNYTSSLFTRDDPAALAYAARQMQAAGYQPEMFYESRKPGLFEQLTTAIAAFVKKPQPAQPQTTLLPASARPDC